MDIVTPWGESFHVDWPKWYAQDSFLPEKYRLEQEEYALSLEGCVSEDERLSLVKARVDKCANEHNIPSHGAIKKLKPFFRLELGSFYPGYYEYSIYRVDGKTAIVIEGHNDFETHVAFYIKPSELDVLNSIMKGAQFWRKDYSLPKGFEVADGYGFDIIYIQGIKSFKSRGYEAYPANYENVVNALLSWFEDMYIKYSEFYDDREKEARLTIGVVEPLYPGVQTAPVRFVEWIEKKGWRK